MKVFITGVSSGIGRELGQLLVREGHEVWGIARRKNLLEELKSELASEKFFYSECDVADEGQVQGVLAEMKTMNFLPDVVVLNSAVFERDLADGFDYGAVKQGFAVNFFGALIWIDKFLPRFLERGRGRFVAVSSTAAWRPYEKSVSLPASKAALSMAFRSLRLRYLGTKVQFATVYFGPVATHIIPEFTTATGERKYFFVLTAETAARKLQKAVFGRKNNYYFPFWLILIFRLTLIFPDTWFSKLSGYLKK